MSTRYFETHSGNKNFCMWLTKSDQLTKEYHWYFSKFSRFYSLISQFITLPKFSGSWFSLNSRATVNFIILKWDTTAILLYIFLYEFSISFILRLLNRIFWGLYWVKVLAMYSRIILFFYLRGFYLCYSITSMYLNWFYWHSFFKNHNSPSFATLSKL